MAPYSRDSIVRVMLLKLTLLSLYEEKRRILEHTWFTN